MVGLNGGATRVNAHFYQTQVRQLCLYTYKSIFK